MLRLMKAHGRLLHLHWDPLFGTSYETFFQLGLCCICTDTYTFALIRSLSLTSWCCSAVLEDRAAPYMQAVIEYLCALMQQTASPELQLWSCLRCGALSMLSVRLCLTSVFSSSSKTGILV